jgi:hypothetical protein
MTLYFGPTFWWFINSADSPDDKHYCAIAACCPVGTATRDGARLLNNNVVHCIAKEFENLFVTRLILTNSNKYQSIMDDSGS